jgi:hypothetical protein
VRKFGDGRSHGRSSYTDRSPESPAGVKILFDTLAIVVQTLYSNNLW